MFYPIALKILRDGCVGAKKLATGTFYYFVQGYQISEHPDVITVDGDRIEDYIYSSHSPGEHGLNISFSAIVGEMVPARALWWNCLSVL